MLLISFVCLIAFSGTLFRCIALSFHHVEARQTRPSNGSLTENFSDGTSKYFSSTQSNTYGFGKTISSSTRPGHNPTPGQKTGTKTSHGATTIIPEVVESSITQTTLHTADSTKAPTTSGHPTASRPYSVPSTFTVPSSNPSSNPPLAPDDVSTSFPVTTSYSVPTTFTGVNPPHDVETNSNNDVEIGSNAPASLTLDDVSTVLPRPSSATPYGVPTIQPSFDDNSHTSILPPIFSTLPDAPIIPTLTSYTSDDKIQTSPLSTGGASIFTDTSPPFDDDGNTSLLPPKTGLASGGFLPSVTSIADSDASHTAMPFCGTSSCSPAFTSVYTTWQELLPSIRSGSHLFTTRVNSLPVSITVTTPSNTLQLSDTARQTITQSTYVTAESLLTFQATQKLDFDSRTTSRLLSTSSGITSLSIAFSGSPEGLFTSPQSGTGVQLHTMPISSTSDPVTGFSLAPGQTSASTLPAQTTTASSASGRSSSTSEPSNPDDSSESHPILSSSVEIAAGAVGGAVCVALSIFFCTRCIRKRTSTIPIKNETNAGISHFSFDS